MKILIAANVSKDIYKRKKLIQAIQNEGHSVCAFLIPDDSIKLLADLGVEIFEAKMKTRSMNPIAEYKVYKSYFNLYKKIQPDLIMSFNVKPNIYGGITAGKFNIPTIANITGLGKGFEQGSKLAMMLKFLYKRAFKSKSSFVFFQNPDDKKLFLKDKIVQENKTGLLPGSGVDLNFFNLELNNKLNSFLTLWKKKDLKFAFVGRLIISKGLRDYITAAKNIHKQHPTITFYVVGNYGEAKTNDPDFLPKQELNAAVEDKTIVYEGFIKNMKQFLSENVDCVVLPSYYREGVPRALLEGAAMYKPLIGADSPGTREPITDGVNGYLCQKQNPDDLTEKLFQFINLSDSDRKKMGETSRKIAEEKFSDEIISQKYLEQIRLIEKRKKT